MVGILTLRLPAELEKIIGRSSRAAKLTKSAYVRAAVIERIAEVEDSRLAVPFRST